MPCLELSLCGAPELVADLDTLGSVHKCGLTKPHVTLCCIEARSLYGHVSQCQTTQCTLTALQVGLKGKGCPGPWVVTPSVYSMLLINTASTVQRGALYPAKPYHEDVDFAHLCEEKQLVVVKCNWLFFHKVRQTYLFALCTCALQDTLLRACVGSQEALSMYVDFTVSCRHNLCVHISLACSCRALRCRLVLKVLADCVEI